MSIFVIEILGSRHRHHYGDLWGPVRAVRPGKWCKNTVPTTPKKDEIFLKETVLVLWQKRLHLKHIKKTGYNSWNICFMNGGNLTQQIWLNWDEGKGTTTKSTYRWKMLRFFVGKMGTSWQLHLFFLSWLGKNIQEPIIKVVVFVCRRILLANHLFGEVPFAASSPPIRFLLDLAGV